MRHGGSLEEMATLVRDPQPADLEACSSGEYEHIERSRVIELGSAELAKRIDWP